MKATKGMASIQTFMLKENYCKERGKKEKGNKTPDLSKKVTNAIIGAQEDRRH
jgi:hypothetical protein